MNEEWKIIQRNFRISHFTIIYNFGEGMISTYFGAEDRSLALFGFVLKRQKEIKQAAANRTHYNLAEIFFYFYFSELV